MSTVRNGTLFAVAVVVMALTASPVTASSFTYVNAGMRPGSMGNAFTGVSDDVNAVLFNPAGLAKTDVYEFAFMHNKKYNLTIGPDYSTSFVGFSTMGYPFGAFGFAYLKHGDDSIMSEESLVLSYGKRFSNVISAGISYKRLSLKPRGHQQQAGDPAIVDQGTSAFDLSVLGHFKGITGGLALRNLGGEFGIVSQEKVPSVMSLGLSFNVADTLLCALDVDRMKNIKEEAGRSTIYHVGIEYDWQDTVFLRVGANDGKPTFGVGLKARNVKLDLAYTEKNVTKDKFMFSAGMFFGPSSESEVERRATEQLLAAAPPAAVIESRVTPGEAILNGKKIPSSMLMVRNGIRYVPGGLVADYMEMSLFFNAETGEGTLQAGEQSYEFQAGSDLLVVDEDWRRLSHDVIAKNKAPWLPLDSLAKVLGTTSTVKEVKSIQ